MLINNLRKNGVRNFTNKEFLQHFPAYVEESNKLIMDTVKVLNVSLGYKKKYGSRKKQKSIKHVHKIIKNMIKVDKKVFTRIQKNTRKQQQKTQKKNLAAFFQATVLQSLR